MAKCELCGIEVSPGDIFGKMEGSTMHRFCSYEHWRDSEKAKRKPPEKEAGKAEEETEDAVEEEAEPAEPERPVPPARKRRTRKQ